MIFANLFFLYIFLPLNLILYYISKNKAYRNILLVVFSLVFYAWGEPLWVSLLLFTSLLDYVNGLLIEKYRGKFQSKLALAASVVINLGLLGVFKYSGFIIENINALTGLSFPPPAFSLPIGISFYTFQTLSYTIDVYRNKVHVQKSFLNFLMFVSLYFQLVAGPIVRYETVENEINNRTVRIDEFRKGLTRMILGLAKKVLIANTAGQLVDKFMGGSFENLTVGGAWFGALMFAIQIYFDFSGYSDMAIGLGWMFGFHFLENFNYPYISKSATEFWRRWHISLGTFFRDYLYIPLGGNKSHPYRNLFVVWFLTGLWHGASWNFILWGLFYGVFIFLERVALKKVFDKLPDFFSHIYLILLTLVGWVLFYFTDFAKLTEYLKIMFGFGGKALGDMVLGITLANNLFWLLTALLLCLPVYPLFVKYISEPFMHQSVKTITIGGVVRTVILAGLLLICTIQLTGNTYNPFLYYRF